jgi:hypothetical protein
MTSLIPESIFTWVSLVGTPVPPRDPNDDDDEEEEDHDHEADEDREPAVKTNRAPLSMGQNDTTGAQALSHSCVLK